MKPQCFWLSTASGSSSFDRTLAPSISHPFEPRWPDLSPIFPFHNRCHLLAFSIQYLVPSRVPTSDPYQTIAPIERTTCLLRSAVIMASTERDVEVGGFYICLFEMGVNKRFHWGLLVAMTPKTGFLLQCTINRDTGHQWIFRERAEFSLERSVTFLCALKVSMVIGTETAMVEALKQQASKVPFDSAVDNCQTWAMNAVYELADQGYIGLQPQRTLMENLKYEANDLAMMCRQSKPQVKTSMYYQA